MSTIAFNFRRDLPPGPANLLPASKVDENFDLIDAAFTELNDTLAAVSAFISSVPAGVPVWVDNGLNPDLVPLLADSEVPKLLTLLRSSDASIVDGTRPIDYRGFANRIERLDYTSAFPPVITAHATTDLAGDYPNRTSLIYS